MNTNQIARSNLAKENGAMLVFVGMKKHLVLIVVFLILTSFAGCKSSATGGANSVVTDGNIEANTTETEGNQQPTGTEFWNPTTEEKETYYRNYLEEHLLEIPNEEITFQVSLSKWVTPGELKELLTVLGDSESANVMELTKLHLFYPNIEGPSGPPELELIPAIGLHFPTDVTDGTATLNMMEKYLELNAVFLDDTNSSEMALQIRSIAQGDINNGDVLIGSFRGTGLPEDVSKWWQMHPDKVRFVQTIIDDIDQAQWVWEPGEEF